MKSEARLRQAATVRLILLTEDDDISRQLFVDDLQRPHNSVCVLLSRGPWVRCSNLFNCGEVSGEDFSRQLKHQPRGVICCLVRKIREVAPLTRSQESLESTEALRMCSVVARRTPQILVKIPHTSLNLPATQPCTFPASLLGESPHQARLQSLLAV